MQAPGPKIFTYDCTLRDGEQAQGVALSLEDKLHIAARLDAFGIDYVEGGFPASNPKDREFFARAAGLGLAHTRLVAFGRVCHKGCAAADDAELQQVLAVGAPAVALVGKAHARQVEAVLQATREENLRMISESVAFAKATGCEVFFDAEHFFDGYADDAAYALACVRAAAEAGADAVVLCETNGGALPFAVERAVAAVAAEFPQLKLGIHCHNDSGCAVANTLAAVHAGAAMVQGTVNGIGERVGNTDLLTVIANLELKMGCTCVGPERLRDTCAVARFVAESCNGSVPADAPYVGASAFAHKGGLHASANVRLPGAYEHVDPAAVGNAAGVVVSELASRSQIIDKAAELGISLPADHSAQVVKDILAAVKSYEARGYSFELADGSLALLILRHLGQYRSHFTLESFRVIVDDREDTGAHAKDAVSEATVKIHVGEARYVATGEGVGPVEALDSALRLAINPLFPQVAGIELIDYKVRILDENVGTGAVTRVCITTRDARGTWGTVGVSENIIEASWNALVDSIEFGLLRAAAVTAAVPPAQTR